MFKKVLAISILASAMFLSQAMGASDKGGYIYGASDTIEVQKLKEILGKDSFLFRNPSVEIDQVIDVSEELYLIKAFQTVDMRKYGKSGTQRQAIDLYVTKSGKTFLIGNAMDAQAQTISVNLDLAPNKDKAAFTYGEGKNDVFVFTDPDCPYCEQFEAQLKNLKPEYKVYFYLYPLKQLHPDAIQKSQYVLAQAKDKRLQAYRDIQGLKNTSTVWKSAVQDKYKQELKAMMDYGTEYVGVKGTPYVVDAKGRPIDRALLFAR